MLDRSDDLVGVGRVLHVSEEKQCRVELGVVPDGAGVEDPGQGLESLAGFGEGSLLGGCEVWHGGVVSERKGQVKWGDVDAVVGAEEDGGVEDGVVDQAGGAGVGRTLFDGGDAADGGCGFEYLPGGVRELEFGRRVEGAEAFLVDHEGEWKTGP